MKITGSVYPQLSGGYNKLVINVLKLGKPLSDYRVHSILTSSFAPNICSVTKAC